MATSDEKTVPISELERDRFGNPIIPPGVTATSAFMPMGAIRDITKSLRKNAAPTTVIDGEEYYLIPVKSS